MRFNQVDSKHDVCRFVSPGPIASPVPLFSCSPFAPQVHSLDSEEGDALQRLIRAVNCNFLALSATIGNAQQVRTVLFRVSKSNGRRRKGAKSTEMRDFLPWVV